MNKALALILPVMLALLVVVALLWTSALTSERALQQKNEQLVAEMQTLKIEVAGLRALTNAIAEAAVAAALAAAQPAVEEAAPAEPTTNAPTPRPYQVRTFLGRKYVGLSWVIPSNLREDPQSGRVTYEPVVRLPDDAGKTLTEYVTNVVEKEVLVEPPVVHREVYVEHRPYWLGVPHYVGVQARHPRRSGIIQPPSVPPARPLPAVPPIYKPPQQRGDPGLYVPPFNR